MPRYLLDFLSVLDSEKVTLSLRDAETQGLFSPVDDEEYSYQYVVMPMQLLSPLPLACIRSFSGLPLPVPVQVPRSTIWDLQGLGGT